jgi:ATP-dependent DNA helicase recG
LKKIATQKVGGNIVAQNDAQDKIILVEFIKEKI